MLRPLGMTKHEEGEAASLPKVISFPSAPADVFKKKTSETKNSSPSSLVRWAGRMRKVNRTMILRLAENNTMIGAGEGGSTADMSSTASTATTSPSLSPMKTFDRDITFTPTTEETIISRPTKLFEKEWAQEFVSFPSSTRHPRTTSTSPKTENSKQANAALPTLPTLSHDQVSRPSSYLHEDQEEYVAPPCRLPSRTNNNADENDGRFADEISTTAVDGRQGINGRVGTVHDPNDYQDDPPLFVKLDPVTQQEKFPDDDDISMSSFETEVEQSLRDVVLEDYEDMTMMDIGPRRYLQKEQHQENKPARARSFRSSSIGLDDYKIRSSDDLSASSSSDSFGVYDGFSVIVPEVRDDVEEELIRSKSGGGDGRTSFGGRGRSAGPASTYSFVGCDYSCSRADGDTTINDHHSTFREKPQLRVPGLLSFSTKPM